MAKRKTRNDANGGAPRSLANGRFAFIKRINANSLNPLLPIVNRNNPWVQRFERTLALHVADLGGEQNVSVGEMAILRRACAHLTELERLEVKLAASDEISPMLLELHGRCSNTVGRLLKLVGLQRRARDVSPQDLGSYLRARANGSRDDAEEREQ